MGSKISVQNVSKIYGDSPEEALSLLKEGVGKDEILRRTGQTLGVEDVSFDVEEGEIFVVMGLSGSGKSTLIRILNRLIPATAGSVEIDGEDILAVDDDRLREVRLKKLAMVFQHFALFPHKSVRENVEYGLKVQGVPADERKEKALKALEQVGLDAWAESRPNALSGGMQQRVGLARGLAVDPDILLMDEPFSALDPLIRRDMQNELLTLQRKLGKTIVFITHDLLEALVLGDRIAIMKEGRFVQVGTAEEIVGAPADDYVAEFTKDIDRSRVYTVDRVREEAEALDIASDTAGIALSRMDETGHDALHVVEDGRPIGLVRRRDLGGSGQGASLRDALVRDYPQVEPGTPLYRTFGAFGAGLPLAIVGADGTLSGVARPEVILDQLANGEDGAAPEARAAETAAA